MDKITKQKIEEIIGQMSCPKDFRCAENGFENLCLAEDHGLKENLVCYEEKPRECVFAFRYACSYLCRCPLRIYLARELGK